MHSPGSRNVVLLCTIKGLIGHVLFPQCLPPFFDTPAPAHFQTESIRSFPSGHSAMTMAGTLYVTLVSWAELSRTAAARKSWLRSVLVSAPLSVAAVVIIFYSR